MRVIVVDYDSTLLETIVRALRTQFVIDTVSTKAGCMDLLRQNDFDVVVACERLEDGSGLELLGQIAKRWPATLRVFAADRERLHLLEGRLAPFDLFQTLAYPINPHKLLSTLLLARGAHEADTDATTIQHIVLGNKDASQDGPVSPPSRHKRPAAAATAEAATSTSARVQIPSGGTRPNATGRSSIYSTRAARAAAAVGSPSEAADAATQVRSGSAETGMPLGRKALIAGAGCAGVVVVVALAVTLLKPPHRAPALDAQLAMQPHFSEAVTDLVAAVETDIEQENFAKAQADVQKLRALAPAHPRLQLFLTLLEHDRTHASRQVASASPASKSPPKATAKARERAPAGPGNTAAPARPAPSATGASASATPSTAAASSGAAAVASATASPVATPSAAAPSATAPLSATAAPSAATPSNTAHPSAAGALADNAAPLPPQASAMPASDSVAAKASLATTFSGRTVEESTTDPTPHASNWRSHPVAAPNAPPSAEVTRVSATAGLPPPVTAEAQLTRRVAPEYPDSAMRKGIEGYVDVHFTITPEGTVTNISVVDANPADIFSHAAMEAVRRWRYDPRVVDGQPVESQSQARLQFRLDSSLSH